MCTRASAAFIKAIASCTHSCSRNKQIVFISVKLLSIRPVHLKVEEPRFLEVEVRFLFGTIQ